tara:strand:+ start:449 stop:922 length:474 start_codon:yes stop_codon:yes gene_type:complete
MTKVPKRNKRKIKKLSLTPLGWREWVFLPSHNDFRIKAKIDTGARSSAIHATNIYIYQKGQNERVKFQIFQSKSVLNMDARLVSYKKIKNSFGDTEIRPLIYLKIKIGTEVWVTEITLAQRSKLTYPMLIGRNTLNKKHIIHSHRSYLASSDLTNQK